MDFEQEGDSKHFRGATIFNDATTGVILDETQVFLCAGEPILAKTCFEEWLWDLACTEIKHIHSNNGVFSSYILH